MTTAQSKEIRAFLTTIDTDTPRSLNGIITELRNHYPMFWFDSDKVQSVLEHCHATTFTLGNGQTYFYFEDEAKTQLYNENINKRVFARLEHFQNSHAKSLDSTL